MKSQHAVDGFNHLQQGDAASAAEAFEKGLSVAPADADCLLGLARVRLLEEEYEEASGLLKRLTASAPGNLEAKSHLAWVEFLQGDDAALETLESVATKDKKNVFAQLNLARAYSLTGDVDASSAAFAKAIALEPQNALLHFEAGEAALEWGDGALAIEHLQRAQKIAPEELVPRILLVGAFRLAGQPDEAKALLETLLRENPEEPVVLEEACATYLELEEPERAVGFAEKLCEVEPTEPDHRRVLGVALFSAGEADRAREVLTKLIEEEPGFYEGRRTLAEMLEAQGDTAGASNLLEGVVAQDPTDPGPANDLALLYFNQPDGMARAEALLNRVLEAHPEDGVTHFNLALALSGTNPAKALEHARQAELSGEEAVTEQATRLIAALQNG